MLDSVIRTVVAKLVGSIIGLALAVGVVVPAAMSESLTVVLAAAVAGLVEVAYYVIGRAIEQRYPSAGRALLSLGMVGRSPWYSR